MGPQLVIHDDALEAGIGLGGDEHEEDIRVLPKKGDGVLGHDTDRVRLLDTFERHVGNADPVAEDEFAAPVEPERLTGQATFFLAGEKDGLGMAEDAVFSPRPPTLAKPPVAA